MSRTERHEPTPGHSKSAGKPRRHYLWYISMNGHASWKRQIRRVVRAKAANRLRQGEEPEPKDPIERSYFD